MKAFVIALVLVALLMPVAASQQITGVSYNGTCMEFTINVDAEGLEGCWDAKLDVPGVVYSPAEEDWRSSFYYISNATCGSHAVLDVRLDSREPAIEATAKLRQGSRIIEKAFTIKQDCPEQMDWEWVILVAVIIILILGYTLVWWWKGK